MTKRPTIADVAEVSGVSKATVSKALNHPDTCEISPDTIARVQAAAEQLGYAPRGRGITVVRRIAVVSGSPAPVTSGAFAGFLDALMRAALGHDLQVQLVPAIDTLARFEQDLAASRIEGVIVSDPMPDQLDVYLAQRRLPTVLVNQYSDQRLSQLRPDDRSLMASLYDHLVALGHRRIAYIQRERYGYHPSESIRRAAFEDMCLRNDIPVRECIGPYGALTENLGDATAAVVYNGHDALELLTELRQRSVRVPRDLSLACFDDTDATALITPALTCAAVRGRDMAMRAVELLVRQFRGDTDPVLEHLDGPLVVRASTGPCVTSNDM
ncbi:MAG: LacI family DNA-binding transcriptional regulator [Planctomycetota bacterium]|jgi:DNA-binding LacI/PurR family transcriptional regulator|nr:LacI family DNA-binding transcriptional regulator [Planctomycetota bacterium]